MDGHPYNFERPARATEAPLDNKLSTCFAAAITFSRSDMGSSTSRFTPNPKRIFAGHLFYIETDEHFEPPL